MVVTKTDPGELTAVELLHLYRKRELSPVEATKAALDRIHRFNPLVNAYCHVDEDGALTAAARLKSGGCEARRLAPWTACPRRSRI